jgi:tRNA dimethylallyltransferase
MGPTASGKSALAMKLAERFDGEIVTVDSAQVYRGMDIGTAKPTREERERVPHHLLDIVDPMAAYSAARFVRDATQAIDAIRARGRLPVVAGGTMLYFKALREGLSSLPQADPRIRDEIDAQAARDGWPAVHAELARVDPGAAARLAPTDSQRIQRALEVFRIAGEPLSRLQGRRIVDPLLADAQAFALLPHDRARLHAAIATRFDAMLDAGIVAEVAALRARFPYAAHLPSMRAVGYRQVWEHLDGGSDAATMRARAIAATRQLAKRQLTWLRATPATVLDPQTMALDDIAARIAAAL